MEFKWDSSKTIPRDPFDRLTIDKFYSEVLGIKIEEEKAISELPLEKQVEILRSEVQSLQAEIRLMKKSFKLISAMFSDIT